MYPPTVKSGAGTPLPTAPLTQATSDKAVIDSTDKPSLIYETEEARALLSAVQEYDRQEMFVRLAQAKKWRKHLHYWNNFQYLAWDEVAHDWRTAEEILEETPQADIDPAVYAKVINVYKAHGEILIGALTSGLPTVRFFPRDADDHEDVMAAKARTKITELIQKQNNAKMLLMKSLFILYNQGLVALYNENKTDFRFGSIQVPEYSDVPVVNRDSYCPTCGYDFGPQQIPPQLAQQPPAPQPCPQCQQTVQPLTEDQQTTQRQQTGTTTQPKNRECLEVYGPLNVKVPIWVREQISTPYLILESEESVGLLKEIYPEVADRIRSTDYPDSWDKEVRVPSLYKNDFPRGQVTVQRCWLRAWALNQFVEEEMAKSLKAKYPDGVYVVILNKSLVVEIVGDKLDDHWTLSENPLAEVLHAEPIGTPMVPMQDIENELTNLTLETIEFGITEVFADPSVLDFESYPNQEVRPGQITQAKAPIGQQLSGGFYEIKPATLSREVDLFAQRQEKKQQFVAGTYPSVFGGAQEGGSGTAREYELSKSSALQRLATTWSITQVWWQRGMAKASESFVKNMQEDERLVKSQGEHFINVWIRRAELQGSVAEVDPEVSEQFPVSWSQKRDVFLHLMDTKNPLVDEVISHPENASLVASIIGVPELFIPGDDSRNKQLYEIAQLITSEPTPTPPSPANPNGSVVASIPVSPELDDHDVEAEICKFWLRSEVGLDAKQTNPAGYANVLAHMKEHMFFVAQAQQMAQQAQAQPGQANPSKGQGQNSPLGDIGPQAPQA